MRARRAPAGVRPRAAARWGRAAARWPHGLGGEFQGEFAAGSGLGEAGGAQPVRVGGAEELAGEDGPAQLEVGVVLPGEADAAEDLDGVLGAGVRGLGCGGGGERGGEPAHAGFRDAGPGGSAAGTRRPGLVGGAGGVPGEGAGLFEADEHVGAEVLDRLERPDGPSELLADSGVFDGGVQAPGGAPAGVGGEEDGGQVGDERGVQGQHPVCRDVDGVGAHLGGGPGRVDAAVRAHGDPPGPGVHEEPALAVGRGGGQQEQVGRPGGQDGRGGAVDPVAAIGRGRGEGAGREGEGGGALSLGELPERAAHRPGPGGHRVAQHGGGERGREVGAGQRGVSGLLQNDGEVEEAPAATAVRLGQMDAGESLRRERLPVGRAYAGGGRALRVEELAYVAGGAARASQARTECASARCSSVIPMPVPLPVPMPMRVLAGRGHWNGARVEHVSI